MAAAEQCMEEGVRVGRTRRGARLSSWLIRCRCREERAVTMQSCSSALRDSLPRVKRAGQVYPDYPPHRRAVEIEVDLNLPGGGGEAVVLGTDLTHEYVSINGDYRS